MKSPTKEFVFECLGTKDHAQVSSKDTLVTIRQLLMKGFEFKQLPTCLLDDWAFKVNGIWISTEQEELNKVFDLLESKAKVELAERSIIQKRTISQADNSSNSTSGNETANCSEAKRLKVNAIAYAKPSAKTKPATESSENNPNPPSPLPLRSFRDEIESEGSKEQEHTSSLQRETNGRHSDTSVLIAKASNANDGDTTFKRTKSEFNRMMDEMKVLPEVVRTILCIAVHLSKTLDGHDLCYFGRLYNLWSYSIGMEGRMPDEMLADVLDGLAERYILKLEKQADSQCNYVGWRIILDLPDEAIRILENSWNKGDDHYEIFTSRMKERLKATESLSV